MKAMLRFMLLAVLLTALTAFFRQNAAAADGICLKTAEGVVSMSEEEYLAGALAAEMPASFPEEALKAQAVAIRSFVAASAPRHEDADVCASSGCCLGWSSEEERRAAWGDSYYVNQTRIEQAIAETAGEILCYEDEPALAVFHAASLGRTESSADVWGTLPYLVSVESPESAAIFPALAEERFVSYAELAAVLDVTLPLIEAVDYDDAGRVRCVTVDGQAFSGVTLREAFGLNSTDCSLAPVCGGYVFSVRGRGHGLGMSQYGAAVYAERGMDYREILAHYYPNTTIMTE